MIQLIFTVYDEKAAVFLPPFVVPTLGLAKRAFGDCINSSEHQFGKHPGDYSLFLLAEFEDTTAEFFIKDKKSLLNGVECIDKDHVSALEKFHDTPDAPIQSD